MLCGYNGKLLRVDLSAGRISEESLPGPDTLRRYLGGLGLGVRMLSDEVPATVGPLDPGNRLIFLTGPLTGLPVPASTSCAVVSVNADTGFTVGAAFTHGKFGAYLKFAGYDGIIIQGAADRPVYLWIRDRHAEIREAKDLWGKDTHETEDLVKKEIEEPRASVAGIGPAGENLIRGACIANDRYHLAAFGGLGAVMGSKKLKAIAVYGSGAVAIAHPKQLVEAARDWWRATMAHGPSHDLWQAGITRNWTIYGDISTLACKNLLSPELGRGISRRFVEACKSWEVVPKPCLGCPEACSYKVTVKSGPNQGLVATMAGGAENMEGAAVAAGVEEPGDIIRLTDHYDRMGLNSCTLGCAVALAFECYEKGLLTRKETDGLELTWGNAGAVISLVNKAIAREGLGKILAEGPKEAAEHIGGNALDYAVYIKGTGVRLHDHRGRFPHMLAAAVCGAARLGASPSHPPDYSVDGAAARVRQVIMKTNFDDSLGICMFGARNLMTTWFDGQTRENVLSRALTTVARVLAAATGWEDLTPAELLTIGERIENAERLFNMSRGLTPADDLDVSARLLEPPPSGVCQGQTVAPHLKNMVKEYYRLMGWDEETGRPLGETLERLGLQK